MSAIAEDVVIKVLYAIHEGFDLLDFAGPLEVLHTARHNAKDPDSEAFDITIVGGRQQVMSAQGVAVTAHINWKEAKERIEEYVLFVHIYEHHLQASSWKEASYINYKQTSSIIESAYKRMR